MSATLLEAPRREASPPLPPPPSFGPQKPRPRPGRNALPIGIIISVLAHVLFLGIRFTVVTPEGQSARAPRVINLPTAPAMQVFDIVGVATDVPTPQVTITEPDEPQPTPTPTVTLPGVEPPVVPSDAAGLPAARSADPLTVTERITPRAGADPRLFSESRDPLRPELDPLNNVRARVYGSIREYNDSMAAEAARQAKALDWSVRDGNGGRWGISPAGIHLGNITLPLPPLGASADERAATAEWAAIQQQAGRAAMQESFEERVRAIRARKEAARDSARRAGGGGN